MTTPTTLTPAKSGDRGDTRNIALSGVENLATVSTVRTIASKRSETTVVLAAAVTDIAERTITVQLGTAPTDWLPAGPSVGEWSLEHELTFADGSILTWPAAGYDTLTVVADLD